MRMLALIACAGALGAATPSPRAQPEQQVGSAQQAKSNLPTSPAVAVGKDHHAHSSELASGDEEKWEPSTFEQEAALWAAVVQAGASVLGVVGLVFTVLYARAAWKSAEKSANAADKTLKATREGERRQLRAYVHVAEATFQQVNQTGVVRFKNFGLTPAHDVWVERAACVRDFPLTETLAPLKRDDALFDLAPNGEPNLITFPFAEWDDLSPSRFGKGGTALYLHGAIHYRDVFKKARTTTFRLFVRSRDDPGVGPCDEGNEAK